MHNVSQRSHNHNAGKQIRFISFDLNKSGEIHRLISFMIFPCFITRRTRSRPFSNRVRSFRGLPSKMVRSATLPGPRVPILSEMPVNSALVRVADFAGMDGNEAYDRPGGDTLSAAGLPENAKDFPFVEVERYIIDSPGHTLKGIKISLDRLYLKQMWAVVHPGTPGLFSAS